MNKDFNAGQIRTTQIIANAKVAGKPGIVILDDSSSGSDGKRGAGYAAAVENAGADVFFFVSGAIGSLKTDYPGATLFGGDLAVSGTLLVPSITGSLTRLADGSSYLVAGTNVTIVTGSNGSVTISSTGGAAVGGTAQFNDGTNKLATTASFSVAGNLGSSYFANSEGADSFFFVSGSVGSLGTATRGTAVFGGDLVVSGALRQLTIDASSVIGFQVFS